MSPSAGSTPIDVPSADEVTITQVDTLRLALMRFSNGAVYDVDLKSVTIADKAEADYFPPRADAESATRDDLLGEIERAGEALFDEMLDAAPTEWERLARNRYRVRALIVEGDESFHRLPWNLLNCSRADNVRRIPVVRRLKEVRRRFDPAPIQDELRVLVVTARPWLPNDIPLRAVIQPMIESGLWFGERAPSIDVLRGGSWLDLRERLNRSSGSGRPYHVVHFDMHGAIGKPGHLRRALRSRDRHFDVWDECNASPEYLGREQAFLFFEQPAEVSGDDRFLDRPRTDPRTAKEVANMLTSHDAQVVVLVTCESASTGAPTRDSNLAYRLVEAGIPAVVGMRHKITADGARIFTQHMYEHLATTQDRDPLTTAFTTAREEMRIAFDRGLSRIDESSLPVLYIGDTPSLNLVPSDELLQRRRARAVLELDRRRTVSDLARFGVFGRFVDHWVLRSIVFSPRMDRSSISSPISPQLVAVTGLAGSGKSTLVRELARHWDQINYVDHVAFLEASELVELKRRRLQDEPDHGSRPASEYAAARGLSVALERSGLQDRDPSTSWSGLDMFVDWSESVFRRLALSDDLVVVIDDAHLLDDGHGEDESDDRSDLRTAVWGWINALESRRASVVVTARDGSQLLTDGDGRISGRRYRLLGLDGRSAVEMVRRITGSDPFDAASAAAPILEVAGKHPGLLVELSLAASGPGPSANGSLRDLHRSGDSALIPDRNGEPEWLAAARQAAPQLEMFSFFIEPEVYVEEALLDTLFDEAPVSEFEGGLKAWLRSNGLLSTVLVWPDGNDANRPSECLQLHPVLPYLARCRVRDHSTVSLHEALNRHREFFFRSAVWSSATLWSGNSVEVWRLALDSG